MPVGELLHGRARVRQRGHVQRDQLEPAQARLSSSAGQPDSVSCPSASFCMAVDAQDLSAFVFNGRTWSSAPGIKDPALSTQMGMASVSCSSPSFCAAVDNGFNAFTFNGTSWSSATTIDPGNELSTVSCPSASFCAAVDYGPNVVTFNGTSWSKPSAIDPGTYLQAVSCARASFCVAIDRKGKALTFNGSAWSAPVNALPNGLTMGEGGISWPVVSCPARDFCAVVDGADGRSHLRRQHLEPRPPTSTPGPPTRSAGQSSSSSCRCPAGPPRSAWSATPSGMRSSGANGKAEFPRRCERHRNLLLRAE